MTSTLRIGLALLATGTFAVIAPAQVIYLPVQYQYGTQNTFYYGGSDPDVIRAAAAPIDAGGEWGRVHGYAFVSGEGDTHRDVTNEPLRVYSDAVPGQNAHLFGYTVADAANAANSSVPRYFRKADVDALAMKTPGILIIPAQADLPPAPLAAPVRTLSAPPTTRPATPAVSSPRPDSIRVQPVSLPK